MVLQFVKHKIGVSTRPSPWCFTAYQIFLGRKLGISFNTSNLIFLQAVAVQSLKFLCDDKFWNKVVPYWQIRSKWTFFSTCTIVDSFIWCGIHLRHINFKYVCMTNLDMSQVITALVFIVAVQSQILMEYFSNIDGIKYFKIGQLTTS